MSGGAGVLIDGRRGRADAVDVPAMGDRRRPDGLVDAGPVRRRVGRHAGAVSGQSAGSVTPRRRPVFFDVEVRQSSA